MNIKFENVTKTFSTTRNEIICAVQDVHFVVDEKELLVMVGPTGSGKTTVLRLIAGLDEPTSGRIFFDEVCVNTVQPKERDVAMVFQNGALYPHMTVRDNMAFGLRLRGISASERANRVNQIAERLEIFSLLERKPETLSGGQRQRVALGRALVRMPKILLLDEPLSNVDPVSGKRLRRDIAALQAECGVPMIYVTHDPREAMSLGKRIAVMKGGRLLQIGTTSEIQARPADEFVAEFFSTA